MKRKIDGKTVEPVIKTSKVDESNKKPATKASAAIKKKAPLKAELLEDFKDLKIRYDALDNENQQNVVMIRNLMSKLESFERRESGKKNHPVSSSVSVQTETILSCQKYDFKVEDI